MRLDSQEIEHRTYVSLEERLQLLEKDVETLAQYAGKSSYCQQLKDIYTRIQKLPK